LFGFSSSSQLSQLLLLFSRSAPPHLLLLFDLEPKVWKTGGVRVPQQLPQSSPGNKK
jgi:hypothetical protein